MIRALLLGSFLPVASAAQEVRGTVTVLGEEAPLAGTLVSLVAADSTVRATTLSDSSGAFFLRAPAGESVVVRVQRLGFSSVESRPLVLAMGDTLRLEIRLRPLPLELAGIEVRGTMRPDLQRFLQRKETGLGRVFTREDILAAGSGSMEMVLARLPGAFILPTSPGSITVPPRPGGGSCPAPRVFVDRLQVPAENAPSWSQRNGIPVATAVTLEEIMGVEVYRNPAQAPPEFQEAFIGTCPIVLIWTNQSFGVGR